MIKIVDYGLGNVLAFLNVYRRLNIPTSVAKSAADLVGATQIILPGVGSFDHAMERFSSSGMREPLEDLVLGKKVPILGICVGMQMLANSSEEGYLPGLGWIDGVVRKLSNPGCSTQLQLPHMGWNDLENFEPSGLFLGFKEAPRFYFLHSYYFDCASQDSVLAESRYGEKFACAVGSNIVYGVQFHPE
jgi:glutamine amidotransferase